MYLNGSQRNLELKGRSMAKKVKVDAAGWSNFVFEENYNLPTLEEVEKHIKEKAHLKNIPSVMEVEEDGIYLGEMDAKLLQKIEELTLYILEQAKKIKAPDTTINNLKKDNEKLGLIQKRLERTEIAIINIKEYVHK